MKKKVQILLVDDDEDDFLLTEDLLDQIPWFEADLHWAKSYQEALEKIETTQYDLFLLDFLLGKYTGLDLLDEINKKNKDLPAILLTGKGDAEIDRVAVEKGAYDYLEKSSINADSLERSIRYALKQAETLRALRESEIKYRTVFDHSKEMIFIANEKFDIISISKSAEEFSGYTQSEIYSMPTYKLLAEPEELLKIEDYVAANKSLKDFQLRIRTKSGEARTGLLSCVLELNPEGGYFIHGIFSDLTDRIKAEKSALQTEKMEATARLMRILAHEVRNPLTNIGLSAESLYDEINDDYGQSLLQIIKRNTLRIDKLITEVLNTAREDQIQLLPNNIHDVLEDSISHISDRADFAGIEILKNFNAEKLPLLNADKFGIAVNNLLVNAIEAMENSKNKILTIETRDFNSLVSLSISDTGCGMNEDQLTRIFEPFFTAKTNGIGLGLAATLGIIESHDASIEVKSEPGEGTTFLILLPV